MAATDGRTAERGPRDAAVYFATTIQASVLNTADPDVRRVLPRARLCGNAGSRGRRET